MGQSTTSVKHFYSSNKEWKINIAGLGLTINSFTMTCVYSFMRCCVFTHLHKHSYADSDIIVKLHVLLTLVSKLVLKTNNNNNNTAKLSILVYIYIYIYRVVRTCMCCENYPQCLYNNLNFGPKERLYIICFMEGGVHTHLKNMHALT